MLAFSVVKSDYRIEELISQSAKMVVYRASGKEGQIYALTRLVLNDDATRNFTDERFSSALAQLKELSHPCLRSVLDGGLDAIDRQPWFVSQWWEGETLEGRLADEKFTGEDWHRLEGLAQVLIENMATFSGALSFQPNEIVSTTAADGSSLETFTIDLYQWMDDWFMDSSPGSTVNPLNKLSRLSKVIQGPPVVRQVYPTVIEAPSVTTLASVHSGNGAGKILILIGGLVALLVGAFFLLQNKNPETGELAEKRESQDVFLKSGESRTSVSSVKKEVASPGRPKRPSFAELQKNKQVSASDAARLTELAGQWVNVRGRVKSVSDQGEWVFESAAGEGLPLKARLESASDFKVAGKEVSVIGFLEEGPLLKIPKLFADDLIEDAEVIVGIRTFRVEDEKKLAAFSGKSIRLIGEVKQIKVSKTSVFLHFKGTKTQQILAGRISKKNLTKTHNLAFFQKLVGKTIGLTGRAFPLKEKRGWYIIFARNMDVEVLENPREIELIELIEEEEKSEEVVEAEIEEYTTADQAKIQARAGETMTLRGTVLSVSASGSGKTLYLNFTAKRPVLAVGIKVADAEEGMTREFLERFIGHEIAVTGVGRAEYGGHRFIISITQKDQINK